MLLAVYPPERRVIRADALAPWWRSSRRCWGRCSAAGSPTTGAGRWIFFINVPVGLVAASLTHACVQGRETPTASAPIDATGLVLLAIWVGSLQIMLDTGTDAGWFDVRRGHRARRSSRSSASATSSSGSSPTRIPSSICACSRGATFSSGVALDEHRLHDVLRHLDPHAAVAADADGLHGCLGRVLPSRPSACFRSSCRVRVASGCSETIRACSPAAPFSPWLAPSFMRAGFTTQVDFSTVVTAQLVTGLGIALFMVPMQSISLSGLRNDQVASAAGLSSFMRVIGGSFGASLRSRCGVGARPSITRSLRKRCRCGNRATSSCWRS